MDVLGEIEAVSLVYRFLSPILTDEVLKTFPKIESITGILGLRINKVYHSRITKDQFLRNLIGYAQQELPVQFVLKLMSKVTLGLSDTSIPQSVPIPVPTPVIVPRVVINPLHVPNPVKKVVVNDTTGLVNLRPFVRNARPNYGIVLESVFERESPNYYLAAKRNVTQEEEFVVEVKVFRNNQVQRAFKVQMNRDDKLNQVLSDFHIKTVQSFGGR